MLEGPFGIKQELLVMLRRAGLKVDDLDKRKKVEGKTKRGAKLEVLGYMRSYGITFEEMKNFKRSDIVRPKRRPKNHYKDFVLPLMKKLEEERNKKQEELNKKQEELVKKRDEMMKKQLDEEKNHPWKTLKKLPKDSSSSDYEDSSSDSEDSSSDSEDDDEVVDDVEDDSDYDEISAIFKKLDDEEAEQQKMRPKSQQAKL